MNTHHALNYIEFGSKDVGVTKTFYSTTFGWEFVDYGPNYAAFKDPAGNDGGFSTDSPVGKGVLVVLYSERLEETQAAVEASGGVITREIFAFPGGRRFQFTDPSGNELAVWSE